MLIIYDTMILVITNALLLYQIMQKINIKILQAQIHLTCLRAERLFLVFDSLL